MSLPEGIRGLLLDVDGTLLVHDRPVPGAAEMLSRLRASGLSFRITTNTTRRPRAAIAEALRRAGLEVSAGEILAPPSLARRRILDSGRTRTALLVPDETRSDFEGIVPDEKAPDWVVIGDLGSGFTWERLNAAFHWLRAGAALLALHKNRYWDPAPGETVLDAGPFVVALEYATGARADVVGKPSPAFFELAVRELGLAPAEALVVGDDPETDGAGGRAAGCRIAMVRTGKFRGDVQDLGAVRADLTIASVAELL